MNKLFRLFLNALNIVLITLVYRLVIGASFFNDQFVFISPYLTLGFLITAAYIAGSIARHFGLPSLTGYLLAGLLFGPHLLGLIPQQDIQALELINALALSFIAITAGGELRLASLKNNFRSIISITLSHTLLIFNGIALLFFCVLYYTPLLALPDTVAVLSFSLLLGVIALANSPSTTIAVITECKSKGDFTDIVLSVTMLKDTIVLVLFSVIIAFISGMYTGSTISLPLLFEIMRHLVVSVVAGFVMGVLLILFFKYIDRNISIFVIIASYLAHEFAHVVGLEHLLMCLIAGFTVQNLSRQGPRMIEAIENSHLPIYVVFFSIAGAGLNFNYSQASVIMVLLFVGARTLIVFGSTYAGAAYADAPAKIKKHSWTAYIANAGLALSMLIIIDETFDGWGAVFKSIMLSVIAVNQIIGPILFKFGLGKTGEARKL